ncbi:hypothetical protein RHGRI_000306 [Rhododendron griersonianum]|uniref:Uncharacterized protein n=1 Tax=Rhododendron griersonianum TaxID=479676 RepID=A0AAV6LJ68_9ERIC|nr:hypothetical protein RHGRI_000306 [Rhododendron griersonianum]
MPLSHMQLRKTTTGEPFYLGKHHHTWITTSLRNIHDRPILHLSLSSRQLPLPRMGFGRK